MTHRIPFPGRSHGPGRERAEETARALGWFSIGLGLTQLLAPRALTRALGLRGRENLVQAYGLREIATGIGVLGARDPAPFLWARAAGDALDLATLAPAWHERNPRKGNVGLALAMVAGIAVLDVLTAEALTASRPPRAEGRPRGLPRPLSYYHRRGMQRPARSTREGPAVIGDPLPRAMQAWENGRPPAGGPTTRDEGAETAVAGLPAAGAT